MIPSFEDSGYLPPGIHSATLEEIDVRFGRQSEVRRAQMESVHWMIDLARRAGVKRIILNGSFVTDIMEPNDVDCVLLASQAGNAEKAVRSELRNGLPFLQISLVREREFSRLVDSFFATDRYGRPKGVVEVMM